MSEENRINEHEQKYRSGQLGINANVIHDTREYVAHQRSIGHEVAPGLFLQGMTEREEVRQENQIIKLAAIQDRLFLQESQGEAFSPEVIRSSLFVEWPLEQVRELGEAPTGTITTPIPGWSIGIFLILGLAILAWGSTCIGQRLAKRRR